MHWSARSDQPGPFQAGQSRVSRNSVELPSPSQANLAKHTSKKFYKIREFLISPAFSNSLKQTTLHVDHPPVQPPQGRHLPFSCAPKSLQRGFATSQVSSTFGPASFFCLSHIVS